MLPGHFSAMQSAALQHILQRCDPNASHISAREDHSGSWAKLSLAALSSLASMSAGAHYMIPVILQAYDSVSYTHLLLARECWVILRMMLDPLTNAKKLPKPAVVPAE